MLAMECQDMKEHSLPCDSETSVDYYVTTVNNCSSQNDDLHAENQTPNKTITLVVSIDQAGTIKLRKRKKSKRRKKKSRSVIQESELHTSDDGILYRTSSSDSSDKKVPRRSVSLCDRFVKKNSTSESFNKILSDYKRGDSRRHSAKILKRGARDGNDEGVPVLKQNGLSDSHTVSASDVVENNTITTLVQNDSSISLDQAQIPEPKEQHQVNHLESNEGPPVKKLDRSDVIATLNAFMLEVQEATSVAKQREDVKKKDPTPPELPSPECIPEMNSENIPNSIPLPGPEPPSQFIEISKTESQHLEQESVASSVFLSDTDQSGKGEPPQFGPADLVKSSDDEKEKIVDMMLMENIGKTEVNGSLSQVLAPCEGTKEKNFDYGLAHLEQVCKLMEQIGNLRKQNQFLMKQVHLLESEVKSLKREKGFTNTGYPDTYQTLNLPKRTRPVGRLKDVFAKPSRKISLEKQTTKRSNQFLTYSNDIADRISLSSSTPASSFFPLKNKKTMSQSHADLNLMNRQRLYSYDDIEVDVKGGKWRFWKAPASKSVDRNLSRRNPLPTTSEADDKSTEVIQKAYLTVDTLLGNAPVDKMTSHDRPRMKPLRTSSRASDISGDGLSRSMYFHPTDKPPVYEENVKHRNHRPSGETPTHKPSFRQKLSKWEKAAAKRLFTDRRSNSVDRMSAHENGTDFSSPKPNFSSDDLYKSMPCVVISPEGNRLDKKHSIQSTSSNEWNSLQETFPTEPRHEKHKNGFRNAIRTHLPSPLRHKSSGKRKTWSFAKRKSGYYLPTTDFTFASSSFDLTESIGEQLSLELDQDAVKGVERTEIENDDGLSMKKNLPHYRAKLNDIDDNSSDPSSNSKDNLAIESSLNETRKESDRNSDDEPTRTRCPFFPSVHPKKRATPVFV